MYEKNNLDTLKKTDGRADQAEKGNHGPSKFENSSKIRLKVVLLFCNNIHCIIITVCQINNGGKIRENYPF